MQFKIGDAVKIVGLFGFEFEQGVIVELWTAWNGVEYARVIDSKRGGIRNESLTRLAMFNA